MPITPSDFLATVNDNAGEVLLTGKRRARFRLERSGDGVSFTPLSSAKLRRVNAATVQWFLDAFNQTQSTKKVDCEHKTMDASYLLAVIKLWQGQQEAEAVLTLDGIPADATLDPDFSAPEGEVVVRSHRQRERSRLLVQMAKRLFRAQHGGRLFCEVCGFDFGRTYGVPDFIEVHHRIPLRDLKPQTKTKPSDLVMVCANCHRMLHTSNPWPTLDELRVRLKSRAESAPPR